MEAEELTDAIHVVELNAADGSGAIRELVDSVNWDAESVSPDDVIRAIEEREATAQTIVDKELALPHARIQWGGDFRLVLGRSQTGVDYGATGDRLHLIVLLVVGNSRAGRHLEVLAAVASLLNNAEFRTHLRTARDVADIQRLLVERARRQHPPLPAVPEIPRRSVAIVKYAVGLAETLSAQALLLAMDHFQSVPWEPLAAWSGRLLVITSKQSGDLSPLRTDTHLFDIPHASLSRMDRANLGLLLAAANGLVDHEREVVCMTGPHGQALDCITVIRPAVHLRSVFPEQESQAGRSKIRPEVILRVMSLAIELAAEGREAHPVGVMFVIGDSRRVAHHTRQLILNPFHGFPRRLRNILDPSLAETVKEFALLDGAFLVETDGTIRSAGTYLTSKNHISDLPGGLGARHQAAAALSADTRAIVVTVSQSTGTVTLFQDGIVVLALERAAMTRW